MVGFIIFLAVISVFRDDSTVSGAVFVSNLNTDCLRCICMASTGCDETFECSEHGFCGPMYISRTYWEEGGRMTPAGNFDVATGLADPHHACAKDLTCATQTVIKYMAKHGRDCNGDGVTDCADYARIHYFGEARCTNSIQSISFFRDYIAC